MSTTPLAPVDEPPKRLLQLPDDALTSIFMHLAREEASLTAFTLCSHHTTALGRAEPLWRHVCDLRWPQCAWAPVGDGTWRALHRERRQLPHWRSVFGSVDRAVALLANVSLNNAWKVARGPGMKPIPPDPAPGGWEDQAVELLLRIYGNAGTAPRRHAAFLKWEALAGATHSGATSEALMQYMDFLSDGLVGLYDGPPTEAVAAAVLRTLRCLSGIAARSNTARARWRRAPDLNALRTDLLRTAHPQLARQR